MVMEIRCSNLDIRVPAVAHKLSAHDLSFSMSVFDRRIKDEEVATDIFDLHDLEGLLLVHADAHQDARLKSVGVANLYGGVPGLCRQHQFFALDSEWADGLLVVEARYDAIAGLDVELHKMDVQVDLAEGAIVRTIFQLAFEQYVYALLSGVGPDG